METQELHQLWALTSWLQTFPEFSVSLCTQNDSSIDINRLTSSLQTSEATLAVANVAEVICGVSIDSLLAKAPCDTTGDTNSGTDLIWNSLLSLSSERARPVPAHFKQSSNLPLAVLGNLLDCAVHVSDKQQRRSLIGRIMTLPKPSQKAIMAMIEMRKESPAPNSSSHSSNSSAKRHKSPVKCQPALPNQFVPTPASIATTQPIGIGQSPTLSQSHRNSSTRRASAHDALSRMNCTGVGTSTSMAATVMRSGATSISSPDANATSPKKSSLRKSGDSLQRSIQSVAFGTPVASMASLYSPEPVHGEEKLKPGNDLVSPCGMNSPPPFLSPGTAESPTRMQSLVKNLQRTNDVMQRSMEEMKAREEALKRKLEADEIEHRQTMMRVEARSLDRIQEMQNEMDERTDEWHTNVAQLQTQVRNGEVAQKELLIAKEELEVMHHNKTALLEATERLRKYKDKVTELNDVKEAFQKEQEAHGQAVDELVRLENELQTLQPVKRQLEEYKIRAIEAEVKLVESQDFIRRMERQALDDNLKHETLCQGVVVQKEQMEDLQRRIQQDTEQNNKNMTVSGVGDTLTELNPALKDELVRLRNENMQLRAFQAKRNDDNVQHLEESLEDTKRLADRYKNEFLNTKETLEQTQSNLSELQQHAEDLRGHIQQWQDRLRSAESLCGDFERQLEQRSEQLDKSRSALSDEEHRTSALRKQVRDWKEQKQESDALSMERLNQLQTTHVDLQHTYEKLHVTEDMVKQLSSEMERLTKLLDEHSLSLQESETSLQNVRWDLDNANVKLEEERSSLERVESQLVKSQKQVVGLNDKLELERTQRQEDANEAQIALETTRDLLETKNRKEQEELQSNMTRLLDDERKASRSKDEKAAEKVKELESRWTEKYNELEQRSASSLELTSQEAQDQIDRLKKEHAVAIAHLNEKSSETHEHIIRKGRKVMEDAKAETAKLMQELHDEIHEHEDQHIRLQNTMDEMEKAHIGKILSHERQLQRSTDQFNALTQEVGESLDKIRKLEREKAKLSHENEQYRRQIGGRHGADSAVQMQLERLQKEYELVVNENRDYKKQILHHDAGKTLNAIQESDERSNMLYRRGGGLDQQMLTQIRSDYEAQLIILTDEKRDLIMKMSSQATDVHKAERRVWEHEEENSKLKDENVSLKLRLQRLDLSSETSSREMVLVENRSPSSMSFHSALQGFQSESSLSRSSPTIDRAKKQKLAQENELRSRFSSITGTPPRKAHKMAAAFEVSTSQTTTNLPSNEKRNFHPNYDNNLPGTDVPSIPARLASPVKSPGRISTMASDVSRIKLSPHSLEPRSTATSFPLSSQENDNQDEHSQNCNQS